jgi:uncharacterized membrane-anchored protein
MGSLGILAVAGLVLVPLVREYADFRCAWGLGRAAALGVTGLVVPAVGIGVVVALPLAAWPYLQWGVTIAASLAAYSLAVRAVKAAVEPARARR